MLKRIVHLFENTINSQDFKISNTNKGYPQGWDSRDDCTEFIMSVSFYLWFPATVNLLRYFIKKAIKRLKKDLIQPWDGQIKRVLGRLYSLVFGNPVPHYKVSQ